MNLEVTGSKIWTIRLMTDVLLKNLYKTLLIYLTIVKRMVMQCTNLLDSIFLLTVTQQESVRTYTA